MHLTNNSSRYDIVDLLRGMAILLVVIRHAQLRIPFDESSLLINLPDQIYSAIFISGNEGVRMFFVISGFLITMNSLTRYNNLKQINAKEFYAYRFARIAPCLIGLIAILSALHFLGVKGFVINEKFSYVEVVFSAITFHLNWLEGMKGYLPGSWDVLWSLSVEEIFYLGFPIICLACRSKTSLYIILIALVFIGPFNRLFLEGNKIWQSKAYLSCMDSIAIGCLCALLSHKKALSKSAIAALSIIGALIVVFVLMVKRGSSFDLLKELYLFKTLLSVGVGLLLISSVRQQLAPIIKKLVSPLLIYGRLSYEIYLTHFFIVYYGVWLFKTYQVSIDYSLLYLLGIIFVSGLLAYIVEHYFSRPMNFWIRSRLKTSGS